MNNFLGSEFYGKIANDYDIPSDDVQKFILTTSDFAKGMQTDINHYVEKDRINNASFRQKLDPISKNIRRRQNPVELVFEDISTFDAENPIVGSLSRKLDVSKKDVTSDLVKEGSGKDVANELVKNVSGPPGLNNIPRNRLNNLRNRPEPKDDNNNLLPPPSPLLQPPPSPPPFMPPPSEKFPPSERFPEPFQPFQLPPLPNNLLEFQKHRQHHHFHLKIVIS